MWISVIVLVFRLSCDFWLNSPVPITKISPSNNIVHEAKSLIEFVRKKVLILIAYQPNNVSCILLFAFSFSTTNSHRFSQARLRVEILRKFESKNRFSTPSIPNLRSKKRFSALQKNPSKFMDFSPKFRRGNFVFILATLRQTLFLWGSPKTYRNETNMYYVTKSHWHFRKWFGILSVEIWSVNT